VVPEEIGVHVRLAANAAWLKLATDPIATRATATARAKEIGDLMTFFFPDEESLEITLPSGSTADSVFAFA